MNKVAIIIPMYNHADYVNICIDSIFKAVNDTSFHVWICDDVSLSNESEKVQRLCEYLEHSLHQSITYVKNKVNLGFSGNVNFGIRIINECPGFTHVCILNSDTIVSDYWLDDLVLHCGNSLVGPVSNSVGNEQIVDVNYNVRGPNGYTVESVRNFSGKWRLKHINNVVETNMLGFFCVLGRKDLFDSVGPFDENFGTGYYEDDDYCLRVLSKGYRLRIVRQAFVHHFGSITFNSLGRNIVNELFNKNRKYFIEKHSTLPVEQAGSHLKALAHELCWGFQNDLNIDEAVNMLNRYVTPKKSLKKQLIIALANIGRKFFLDRNLVFLGRIINFAERFFIADKKQKKEKLKSIINRLNRKKIFFSALVKKPRIKDVDKYQIIYIFFPIQSYFGRVQRPQHIFNSLKSDNSLKIWIDPDLGCKLSIDKKLTKISDNSYLISVKGVDFSNFYNSGITLDEADKISETFTDFVGDLRGKSVFCIFQSHFWVKVVNKFPDSVAIYDCMDLHSGFGSTSLESVFLENALLDSVDKVVVSSDFLLEEIQKEIKVCKDITVIRNGCNPSDFEFLTVKNGLKKIGYFGAVAEWFDAQLLIESARRLPEFEFEIIGEVTNTEILNTILPENIKLIGEVNYKDLSRFARHWTCGIILFKITHLIKATNPVKLYEYNALGLPVISTKIPEVIKVSQEAYIIDSADEFIQALTEIITTDSDLKRRVRREYACNNSWSDRAISFEKFINN